MSDESLFREVDEEVRQEQLKKLWDRYGNYVIALCLGIVIAVAALKGWQYWQLKQSQTGAAAYANALKLIGEQYLTRVYGLASRRFHLADWDVSITRKLQTIDSIYSRMADRAATRRLEMLEWIIIVLFTISIVVSLGPALLPH